MSRIHWTPGARTLFYQGKSSHDDPQLSLLNHPDGETFDVFEFIARVIIQIPEPRKHNIHYYGFYSSRARALRNQDNLKVES
ncbi:MAG: transposase, partial [Dehalococcoidia bacterium]